MTTPTTPDPAKAADSRRRRFRQMLVSGLGLGAPSAVAILALPVLIGNLGVEQFSLFALFWTLIAYSTLFEFGLGKGVTRELAGHGTDKRRVAQVMSTSVMFSLALAGVVMLALFFTFPMLLRFLLRNSADFLDEARRAGHYLLVALPFITMAPIFFGFLESQQDFRTAAACRATIGCLILLAPALVTIVHPDVASAIAAVVAVRVLSTLGLALITLRRMGVGMSLADVDPRGGARLLAYGGWITVTTLTTPIMLYADRFILTSAHGLAVTSLYLIPFEFLVRLMLLPTAISLVTFPRFATTGLSVQATVRLIRESTVLVLLAFGVPALVVAGLVLLNAPALAAVAGTVEMWRIAAWLLVGFLVMSMTYSPQTYLLASGHAALLARFSVLELVLWLAYTPLLILSWGTTGAIVAFTTRALITLTGYSLMVGYTLGLRRRG